MGTLWTYAAEDFDEALSKIQQMGTLREYQREFERLQNKVTGWTQKALIGTYIGVLIIPSLIASECSSPRR